MKRIFQSMALSALVLVGLVGCDYDSRVVKDTNPVRVAEMQRSLRDLWLGHIYWMQHAVLNNALNSSAKQAAAETEVLANAKQIASAVTSYYGEARSEALFTLLIDHIAALKEYSKATIEGNTPQQDEALARLASNSDDIAVFLNGVNPHHLSKDTVRGLIAAHVAHHVLQINQYKRKEYAKLDETWPMMRQHVYDIADCLTIALVKQFPSQFS
ncbi:MAG: hypothetical protein ABI604_19680 [Nitrospirota bacterium]